MYDLETNELFVSLVVIFHEDIFPFFAQGEKETKVWQNKGVPSVFEEDREVFKRVESGPPTFKNKRELVAQDVESTEDQGTKENNAGPGYAERNGTAESHRSDGPGAESLTEGPSGLVERGTVGSRQKRIWAEVSSVGRLQNT